ncbi:Uncharacterised protein [Mycoplasmopsis caviae]|uniref:Uncharacterized protein n=1 Tax=Mycoplasmopsis caviae TaxID=55603 RepID=A0A3P8L7Z5_9BACT|nr:Uncharacterised protein [Mycoplasmopsis caviae]
MLNLVSFLDFFFRQAWGLVSLKYLFKNAHKLESENWSFIIQTLKNNKPRYIRVPSKYDMPLVGDLRRDLMKYLENLNLTTKSIKNMFCEFSKYIKQKYPNFKHQISAHILRHNFATKSFL